MSIIVSNCASELTVRRAVVSDLDALTRLFAGAQRRMAALGIDQWQDGYPERERIAQDISEGIGVAFVRGDRIAGYAALLIGHEPVYDALDGKWLQNDLLYATVHRMAVNDGENGHGLGADMIATLSAQAEKAGCASIRVDTHRGNTPMRRLMDRTGFAYCGEVLYECGGDPIRAAYEKRLGASA